jgi:hypothetical protein
MEPISRSRRCLAPKRRLKGCGRYICMLYINGRERSG